MERRKDQTLVLVEEIDEEYVRLVPCKVEENKNFSGLSDSQDRHVIKEIPQLIRSQPGTNEPALVLPNPGNLERLKEKFKLAEAKAKGYPLQGSKSTPNTSKQALKELQATNSKEKVQKKFKPAERKGFSNHLKIMEPQPSTSQEALQELRAMNDLHQSSATLKPMDHQPSTSREALQELRAMNDLHQSSATLKPMDHQPSTSREALQELRAMNDLHQSSANLKSVDHQHNLNSGWESILKIQQPRASTSNDQELRAMNNLHQNSANLRPNDFEHSLKSGKVSVLKVQKLKESTSEPALQEIQAINDQYNRQQNSANLKVFQHPLRERNVSLSKFKEPQPSMNKHAQEELKEMTRKPQEKEESRPEFEYPLEKRKVEEVKEPQQNLSKLLQDLIEMMKSQPFMTERDLLELKTVINMYKQQEKSKVEKSKAFQCGYEPGKNTSLNVQEPRPSTSKQSLLELQAMNRASQEKLKLEESEVFKAPSGPVKEAHFKVIEQISTVKAQPAAGNRRNQPKRRRAAQISKKTRAKRAIPQIEIPLSMELRSSKRARLSKEKDVSNQCPREASESDNQSVDKKEDFDIDCGKPENPPGDLTEIACVKVENDEKPSVKEDEGYSVLQLGPRAFLALRVYKIVQGMIKRNSEFIESNSTLLLEEQAKKLLNEIKSKNQEVKIIDFTPENDKRSDYPSEYTRVDNNIIYVNPEDSMNLNMFKILPETGQVTLVEPSNSGAKNSNSFDQPQNCPSATYSSEIERLYKETKKDYGHLRVYKYIPRSTLAEPEAKEKTPRKKPSRSRSRSRVKTTVKNEKPFRYGKPIPQESPYQIQTRSRTMAGKTNGTPVRRSYKEEDDEDIEDVNPFIPKPLPGCSEPLYCFCKNVSYGYMVMCDNEICPWEWFHYPCVGINKGPKGTWFCPKCRAKRSNIMKPMSELVQALVEYNKEKEDKE